MSEKNYVLILLSGGIDSMACINYFKNLDFQTEALFIDYRQKSNKKELSAVSDIVRHFDIKLHKIMINTSLSIKDGFINGRNLLLISIAIASFPRIQGFISLGIHGGTLYPDCSREFIVKAQNVLDIYSSGRIVLDCPFISFSKPEIFTYCLNNNLPLNLTYSCELGLEQPCERCNSCKDIIKLYESTHFKNHTS